MLEILDDYIAVDVAAPDAESIINLLAAKLYRAGAVGPGYAAATIAREKEHPTGLPTKPFCIAIPHADANGVLRSALAVATLKQPVTFRNMADPDEELAVEVVLLLANNSPEEAGRSAVAVFTSRDRDLA